MSMFDSKGLEVYCRNDKCGDPVLGANGVVYFTKRRMNYAGYQQLQNMPIYKCPVCGATRVFTRKFVDEAYYEI